MEAPATGGAVLIHDGGIPALVAGLLTRDPESLVAWVLPWSLDPVDAGASLADDAELDERLARVYRQSELFGFAEVVRARLPAAGTGSGPFDAVRDSMMLLEAAREAVTRRLERVIWPVWCGSDLSALGVVCERASLVTRLLWLGEELRSGGSLPGPRIEVPLADLSTEQILDLARDLDVPLDLLEGPSSVRRATESTRLVSGLGLRT